jgi:hypothetical protein
VKRISGGTRPLFALAIAAALGFGATQAMADANSVATADRVEYKYLYKDSYSQTVGIAYQYCDGDYFLHWGYVTPNEVVAWYIPCP